MTETFVEYLKTRRTVPSANLKAPAPDSETLNEMLEIAARVPDHGKLAPWRFLIYEADQGAEIGERLCAIWQRQNKAESKERLELERNRFLRAPLVVGILSKTVEHKIPRWEQQLSAGAVCMNLIHAAHAYGFNAQWLTEWYTYDDEAASFLGAHVMETFAGFIHIGTPDTKPVERARPDLASIVTRWQKEE